MCGVVGLIGTADAATEAFLGLTTLQHRGQDAAGILAYDSDGFHRVKNVGLVESVFTRENMKTFLTGNSGDRSRSLQHDRPRRPRGRPASLIISYPFGLRMVHNGNIVNCADLAADLKKRARRHLLTHSDTEIVLNVFAESLAMRGHGSRHGSWTPDFRAHLREPSKRKSLRRVNGSYSIVTLVAGGGLLAFRDPHRDPAAGLGQPQDRTRGRAGLAQGRRSSYGRLRERLALVHELRSRAQYPRWRSPLHRHEGQGSLARAR